MAAWYQDSSEFLIPTYDRIPVDFVSGHGVYLTDSDGNRYLDALAGIAVNILGYAHPRIAHRVEKLAGEIHHVSNLFQIRSQTRLASMLNDIGFDSAAFFCNSGAEANEAAIKLARKYVRTKNSSANEPPLILSFEKSFHGRTLEALGATGQEKYRKNFGPFPRSIYAEFNNPDSVESILEQHNIAGILVESIQGEGGVRPAEASFLQSLRELCDQHDVLLMFDEVQAGMGRTGNFFGFEFSEVEPDVVTLAKGLGGGFPIGTTLVRSELQDVFQPGDHASTFGGNPFVTAVACTVLETFELEDVIPSARDRGRELVEGLELIVSEYDRLRSPRGRGLMIGIPCEDSLSAGDFMERARDHGLIVGVAGDNVIRLVPPLIISSSEVGELLDRFRSTIESM